MIVPLLCVAAAVGLYHRAGRLLSSGCVVRVVSQAPSPDGERRAFVHDYDCGATSSAATHVSVLPADERPEEPGNVLVVDHGHEPVPPGTKGGPHVTVAWTTADRLKVTRPAGARVFRAEPGSDGVTIGHVLAPG
ncbi:hypothetical protein GCM10010439_26730 [Actinocorallia aurantiaca]|uniref:Uncharacterized protein n=1 Tax=Actinocorallia aurantiaca TaxID=46204 RepID=A0ABP6GPK4_9ACTN